MQKAPPPRMLNWVLLTAALLVAALWTQAAFPSTLIAVTLYKAHLLALGGWAGYWLDRALFPYDRPHEYLEAEAPPVDADPAGLHVIEAAPARAPQLAMIRRAIIVAACLVCVGLGA